MLPGRGVLRIGSMAGTGVSTSIPTPTHSGVTGSTQGTMPEIPEKAGTGTGKIAEQATPGSVTYNATAVDITIHNLSETPIRATASDAVIITGPIIYGKMMAGNIMDMRALPGFARGAAPTGGDDPDQQVVRHVGGETEFELTVTEDCEGA